MLKNKINLLIIKRLIPLLFIYPSLVFANAIVGIDKPRDGNSGHDLNSINQCALSIINTPSSGKISDFCQPSKADLSPEVPNKPASEEIQSSYQLIVLMDSDEITPTKINSGQYKSTFGETIKTKHLISHRRKKVGKINNSVGLTPEEIETQQIGHPDFKILHHQSIAARLQRYIILSYKDEKQLEQAKTSLSKNPNIKSVSKINNDKNHFSLLSNDPLSQNIDEFQYGLFTMNLQNINMTTAWDRVKGHAYIGILDSGLDIGHPDFLNSHRNHFSYDFFGNDNDVTAEPVAIIQGIEFMGHGQHVSGIIAADSNNNLGTTGICWNCSIIFARGLYDFNKISGYTFLANMGAQVINSSFPLYADPSFTKSSCDSNPSDVACDAISLLAYRDVVQVAAAGNGDGGLVDVPILTSNGQNNFISCIR